jgi:hypothetical protein
MTFDTNRFTFDHRKDYLGPVMLQGRVQVASDWNEWLRELTRRTQAGTLDILGRAVYPATTPYAFEITASGSSARKNQKIQIGPGRMYVDGLLVENHGDPASAAWDPVLAELSNMPQPPAAGPTAGAIDYTAQPFLPLGTSLASLTNGDGPYLVYLDSWIRSLDYLNDPDLIDKAIGLDATGRLQTAWQVRLQPLDSKKVWACDSTIDQWPPPPSAGQLSTGTTWTPPSGPCCLTSGSAYTGLENQLYRVEIHKGGPVGTATFKMSRDNGSVVTGVTSINTVTNSAGKNATQLGVMSLGRDQMLGFAPGNWIEITDDSHEFSLPETAGELLQIDTIDVAARTITLAGVSKEFAVSNPVDPKLHTRIRRWDQSGNVYEQDGTTVYYDIDAANDAEIPVPPKNTWLILENGITVSFDVVNNGNFVAGDFWTFAARTADGSVEQLVDAPPAGIHHHYARLSIVSFPSTAPDCRVPWPPSSTQSDCGCCCTVTVRENESINDAISRLPAAGGEVCILPGRYEQYVVIDGKHDVVLRGCGWQTILASPSSAPSVAGAEEFGPPAPPAGQLFNAVVTVSGSEHVKLLSFAVEAAEGEIGVLVDGAGTLHATGEPRQPIDPQDAVKIRSANDPSAKLVAKLPTQDITLEDLVLTASTLPAILADRVRLLQIESNRVAMADVASEWPAVWVSGTEMRIARNWLGIIRDGAGEEWLPLTVASDVSSDASSPPAGSSATKSVPCHPGGLQIAGDSTDVFVLENEIDGAGRNGITLGSVTVLTNGKPTGGLTGVTLTVPGPCDTTLTLFIPGTPDGGQQGETVVAAGELRNIEICRNRIRDTGLCGIGPVGFFDRAEVTEVISIVNLTIAANTITSTLLCDTVPAKGTGSVFGYGAICVPDVQNLVVRDNAITDFGRDPGLPVCGIFVLTGEMVEISRNHVLERRDWMVQQQAAATAGLRGGIVLLIVTPPVFPTANNPFNQDNETGQVTPTAFLPNLPALRVEHNTVRVALGTALAAIGSGPFSVVNNHLATGGTASGVKGATIAETVLILNLAAAIESETAVARYEDLIELQSGTSPKTSGVPKSPSCGAIVFTNNTCQLESSVSHQTTWASVLIFGLDDLIFGNNECWLDGPNETALADAILLAGSLQVTSNRFQEAAGSPVLRSAIAYGLLNITSLNISTYALIANALPTQLVSINNLVV